MGIFGQKGSLKKSGQLGVWISFIFSFIFLLSLTISKEESFLTIITYVPLFGAFGSLIGGSLIYGFFGNGNK